MKLLASLLTVASVLLPSLASAKPWQEVMPDAPQFCASDETFAVAQPTASHLSAADMAKAKFCGTVASSL